MSDEQTAAEALDDLAKDKGMQMFSELAGDRLGVSPTALKPFMMAMALEVGVVMMNEQLIHIDAAMKAADPVGLLRELVAAHQTLDRFTALAMEARTRIGLDNTGASWPEVVEDGSN